MDTAYFVLGMHRSGTSALASTLQSLGIDFGSSLLAPSPDNPKGYFENKAVQAFNENLFTLRGYSWSDTFFDIHGLEEEIFNDLVARAQKIILSEFSSFSEFGLKDPRLCILFPIWYQACKSLGIKVKVVLAYRDPGEIALSLFKRNGIKHAKAFTLWADHMSKAERYTRDFERILTSYDSLVDDFDNTVSQLLKFIGKTEGETPDFEVHPIDKTLRHYKKSGHQNISLPSCILDILGEFKSGKLDSSKLDKAFSQLEQLKGMFDVSDKADLLSQVFNERKKYKLLKDDYENKLKAQNNEIENLQQSIDDLKSNKETLGKLEQKIETLTSEKVSLTNKVQLERIEQEQAFNEKLHSLEVELLRVISERNELKQSLKIREYEQLTQSNQAVEALKEEKEALVHENHLAQVDVKILEQAVSTVKLDKKVAQRAYERTKQKLTELETAYNKVRSKLADIEKFSASEKARLTELNESVDELNKEKQRLKKENKQLELQLHQKNSLFEESAAAWFSTAFSPLSKLINSKLFQQTKSKSLNFVNTIKLNRRLREALLLTEESVKKTQLIPLSFMLHFDEKGYLAANEDIEAAIGVGEFTNGLEHFLLHGFEEVLNGKRKIHLKRRYYKKVSTNEKESLEDFTRFLRHFYEGEAFSNSTKVIKPNLPEKKINKAAQTVTVTEPEENRSVDVEKPYSLALSKRPVANYLEELSVKPTVDIILPVYNALDDVKACIASLYYHNTYPFNLIIIDDCSEHETQQWLREEQKRRDFTLLRNTQNLRFTKTVNKGFKESRSEFVVLLNSDTIVTAYWLEKILLCFQSDDLTGIVGPLSNAASWQTVPVREDRENGGWLVNEIPEGYTLEQMGHLVETVSSRMYPQVPSVNGFCYTIRREVINKIGTLDEEYFPTGYGEEDDFSIRARKAGFNIRVADDTYVFHAKSKSYTKEVRKVLTVGGRKSLDKKHGKEEIERLIANWKAEPHLPAIGDVIASFMHESTGKKRVVYTAIFGGYDELKIPEYINEHWDYVCFTDNPNLKSELFKIKLVKPLYENSTKNARMVKLLSHLFLIGYEFSLWIDGSVKLRGMNIDEHIDVRLSHNYIALHSHVVRSCVYEEEDACSQAQKDSSDILSKQVAFYKNEGMPQEFGLFETAEIARSQYSKHVHELNAYWWQQLDRFSIRDQISLPFVFWKHGYEYAQMPGTQWIDAYFHMYKHHQALEHNKEYIDIVIPVKDESFDINFLLTQILEKTKYANFGITICAGPRLAKTLATSVSEYDVDVQIKTVGESITPLALNSVIKGLRGDYTCILQPEVTLINSDWLSMLRWGFDRENNIYITGPTVLDEQFDFVASGLRLKRKDGQVREVFNSAKLGATGSVGALHESCVLVNKKRFIQMGGFDKDLREFRSSIIEFCYRVTKAKGHNYLVLHSELITNQKTEKLSDHSILLQKLNDAS